MMICYKWMKNSESTQRNEPFCWYFFGFDNVTQNYKVWFKKSANFRWYFIASFSICTEVAFGAHRLTLFIRFRGLILLLFVSWMKCLNRFTQVLLAEMCVDFGGGDTLMAEHVSDGN